MLRFSTPEDRERGDVPHVHLFKSGQPFILLPMVPGFIGNWRVWIDGEDDPPDIKATRNIYKTSLSCVPSDAAYQPPKSMPPIEAGAKAGRRVGCPPFNGDVIALIEAGLLDRTGKGGVEFPYEAIKVEFLLEAA